MVIETDMELIANSMTGKLDVKIWPPVYLHPEVTLFPGVVIGRFTNICGKVTIGKGTRHVCFTNVKFPKVRGVEGPEGVTHKTTWVGNGAILGAGAIICPGINIGEGAMVGAGSVVTKDVPAGWLAYGTPARVIREVREGLAL
jgi:acetyltransferase-like isoleucine patch superfamily enzyme